jgi:hypothetical protein
MKGEPANWQEPLDKEYFAAFKPDPSLDGKRFFVAFPPNFDDMTPEEQDAAMLEMAYEIQRQLGVTPIEDDED